MKRNSEEQLIKMDYSEIILLSTNSSKCTQTEIEYSWVAYSFETVTNFFSFKQFFFSILDKSLRVHNV